MTRRTEGDDRVAWKRGFTYAVVGLAVGLIVAVVTRSALLGCAGVFVSDVVFGFMLHQRKQLQR